MNSILNKAFYACAVAGLFMTIEVHAQKNLNFGQTHIQDRDEMPVYNQKEFTGSAVDRSLPAAKEILTKTSEGEYVVSGGWQLTEAANVVVDGPFSDNVQGWYDAVVPGTVLSTLVCNGVYPDPYFGMNNMMIPDDLCRKDWWYRTSFRLPENLDNGSLSLVFEGINYRAEIWLNRKYVGRIDGAFIRGIFNITSSVNPDGINTLAVKIIPPANPGIPHEQTIRGGHGKNGGVLCLDGPTFISSEGWDWVPGIRDRNIGIWQNVRLSYSDGVRLSDPQVITNLPLPDTSSAKLTVRADVDNITDDSRSVIVRGIIEGNSFERRITVKPNSKTSVEFTADEFPSLNLKNPRLWWPNTMGAQEMYTMRLEVIDHGKVSFADEVRFGVREFSYELTADTPEGKDTRIVYSPTDRMGQIPLFDNISRRLREDDIYVPSIREGTAGYEVVEDNGVAPHLIVKVNGEKVFCKGGNWGMDDAMKNVSREHLEPYFRLHKDANLNMVRNWTGESTEETFYELCDEYGMLVFNDFWISTQYFNLDVSDDKLLMDNATDVVRRFRNHPSIVIWNPRNEGFAPDWLEERLNAMVAEEDGTRHYQPNSRSFNLRTSGPWSYSRKPSNYFTKIADGFSTELGTTSVPTYNSLKKMLAEEDFWPINDAWAYHDFHNGQKDYCKELEERYGKSSDAEDFCRKAQMMNFDAHRVMFEAWNSKMWRETSGLLLWMTHPAWPSMVWQIYSWDYETYGSYYGVKKACEPVHAQINLADRMVQVVNASQNTIERAQVVYEIFGLDGKVLHSVKQDLTSEKNSVKDCFVAEVPGNLPEVCLERVTVKDRKGNAVTINEYWMENSKRRFAAFNETGTPSLKATVRNLPDGTVSIEVCNVSKQPAIGLKFNLVRNNEIVLPAYFSDGYFTLLPGEKRKIVLDVENAEGTVNVEGYNLNSTVLTIL